MSVQGVRYCRVIDVEDSTDSDLITVRLEPEDNGNGSIEQTAFPLLPKMFHVKPKPGEGVLVFLAVDDKGYSQRYYIGPVISQDDKIWYDESTYAPTFMRGREFEATKSPSGEKKCNGVLPNNSDICVRGRKNSDIQVTDDDVRIKSGVKISDEENPYNIKFNTNDPAFVKVKYHPGGLIKQSDVDKNVKNGKSAQIKQVNSTVTLVADKINILSTQSKENKFKLPSIDQEDLISDKTLKYAIDEAYKLPYGEKLVEILQIFINAFLSHKHPFPMKEPVTTEMVKDLTEKKAILLDGGELLSDSVRIN